MVPGLGHLHMNQQKTVFKILDKILLEPLAKDVLHFNTQAGYQCFVDSKDTHKSWQAIQVLLIGTTLELIRQYKMTSPKVNSPMGFLEWISKNRNPTLKMLAWEHDINIRAIDLSV